MGNKLLSTAEIQNNLTSEKTLSKTQLRRKRYEDSTMNRPVTLRAHPDLHESIKKYAKSGYCNNFQKLIRHGKALRLKLEHQVSGPVKWSDKFTNRDAILSFYAVVYTLVILVMYEIATIIRF